MSRKLRKVYYGDESVDLTIQKKKIDIENFTRQSERFYLGFHRYFGIHSLLVTKVLFEVDQISI